MQAATCDLLARPRPHPPFALLHRPEAAGGHHVELLLGDVRSGPLADIPLPDRAGRTPAPESWCWCRTGRSPSAASRAATTARRCSRWPSRTQASAPGRGAGAAARTCRPSWPTAGSTWTTRTYAEIVRRVLDRGDRAAAKARTSSSSAPSPPRSPTTRPARRWRCSAGCCVGERGAYWTFLVHTGERTFVGATPERHVSVARRHRRDEPDQRHLPLPADRPDPGRAAALPRRPQGDRRAVHGRRRGAEDDGPDLRRRRPGGRART